MRFEDFVLQFDASSRGGFRARVLKSPFGEGAVGFSLPSSAGAEPASHTGLGTSRDIGHQSASSTLGTRPQLDIGTGLFRSIFHGQVRTLFDKSRGQLEISPNLGLRLKIKLDPSDEETGALADLPWELLCDGETEDFFALSRQTSLVRYLDVPRSSQPIPFTPPLRILAVAASPHGLPPLDLEEEARRLEELNQSSSGVEVRFLAHASAGRVREALSGDTYNVLHFMGHGTFDRSSGEGMLAFEGSNGAPDLVSGKAFATKLKDLRSLGVVVLNACNTARAGNQGGASPFRGVATALVLGGVPGVVAMQRPISDLAAIGFSTAFYRHLARGDSIDEALTEGRQAIHSAKPEAFEWATPVLFLRIPDGNVFVARPASSPEAMPPAATMTATSVLPTPRPVSSNRRGLSLKIGAGAAGVVLAAVLIPKIIPDAPSGVANSAVGETSDIVDGSSRDNLTPPIQDGMKDRSRDKSNGSRGAEGSTVLKNTGVQLGDVQVGKDPSDSSPNSAGNTDSATQAPAPTADLSSLATQMVSLARRDEGGLRVTVSFQNAGSLPLSVVLDAEGSVLSDDQGQIYSVLDSDLPWSGSNPRLDLAAGASSRHTLDFQAPKAGSKRFTLALLTQDGRRLKVAGSLTLEGSP